MAAISRPDYRLEYVIELGDRIASPLELTATEAAEMYAAGFTFSIYRPETGEFQLSRPYKVLHVIGADRLYIQQ